MPRRVPIGDVTIVVVVEVSGIVVVGADVTVITTGGGGGGINTGCITNIGLLMSVGGAIMTGAGVEVLALQSEPMQQRGAQVQYRPAHRRRVVQSWL